MAQWFTRGVSRRSGLWESELLLVSLIVRASHVAMYPRYSVPQGGSLLHFISVQVIAINHEAWEFVAGFLTSTQALAR